MYQLTQNDIATLAAGAALLGSGGGGNTKILYDLVHYVMEIYGDVTVINIDEIIDDNIIVPIAFVGAPLIGMEKIPNIKIFDTIYQNIIKDFPDKKIILMPAEIGGCNALAPFILAAKYQLPILDADLIGRAFPAINMCKPAILNHPVDPSYLADCHGNIVKLKLTSLSMLEKTVRDLVVSFGSSAVLATFLLTAKEIGVVIPNSISRALAIGESNDLANLQSTNLAIGRIDNIEHRLDHGFLKGCVSINTSQGVIKIYYQNEYLLVKQDGVILAASPDIIAIVDAKTLAPISTEALQFGIEVIVLKLPAPDFWKQPIANPIVHHSVFNLE